MTGMLFPTTLLALVGFGSAANKVMVDEATGYRAYKGGGWSMNANMNYDGGAHGPFHSKQTVTKTVSAIPKHNKLMINARFWAFDSWDRGEFGQISLDG